MKVMYILSLVWAVGFNAYGQSEKIFDIMETISSQRKTESSFERQDSAFFEDEKYVVKATCSGEWGGSIRFTNKKTGITYSCEATCPVAVNKIGVKYIVTTTLAHMMGFSRVLEIDNPDSLSIFKLPSPKKVNGNLVRYVGEDESKSKQGSRTLVDSMRVLILAAFPYRDELFYIVTDFQKTFVDRIEVGKFVTVDTLPDTSIWTYNPKVIRTKDKHYIVFFNNEAVSGYLDIFENKITLVKYS